MKKWIIFGAGEFGKEIYEIFFNKKKILSYFIDDKQHGRKLYGIPVISTQKILKEKKNFNFVIAILNPTTRSNIINKLKKYNNLKAQNLVHKNSINLNLKNKGYGNIFYPYSNINYRTKIGNFNIFQFNSSIGHNVIIKNNCFFGTNSIISSDCRISENVFVGGNSTIVRGKKIEKNVKIGQSCLISKNLKSNSKILNIPRYIQS